MVAPSEFRQRSFLARTLSAAGANFGQLGDTAVALDFGAAKAERAATGRLGLTDLSPLARRGFKGAGTSAWVGAQGADLPGAPNQATRQPGGELIARLAPEEALILSDLDKDGPGLVERLSDAWTGAPGTGYPVPRQDSHAWLYLSGQDTAALFLKICAVDLGPHKFADLSIAQTSVARLSAIVIRDDRGGTLGYHLLADSASAAYLWDCLIDAMAEFDGRRVGLSALRAG